MTLNDRLEFIKKINNEKKAEKSKQEGKLESLKEQMKRDFNCDTIEELKVKADELSKIIEERKPVLEQKIAEMEKTLGIV